MLIALDKFVKAIGLVVVSFFLGGLARHRDQWVELVTQGHIIHPLRQLLLRFLSTPEKNIHLIHVIVIVLAGLYLIEGAGLVWDLKWAEWMVVISTASFIPFEIYEIWRESTPVKWVVLALNIVIFAYLAFRLHRLAQVKRSQRRSPKASPLCSRNQKPHKLQMTPFYRERQAAARP